MKLHYFVALVVFNALLFGIAASVHAETKLALFGPARGLPTRLFGSTSDCDCEQSCEQSCDTACEPACAATQKACDYGMAQKTIVQKSVVQKDVFQKGEADCCESDCRPNVFVRAFAKLDEKIKGAFCTKSDCCGPCYDSCCETVASCGQKSGSAYASPYSDGSGEYGSPAEFQSPSQYDGLEEPLLDGNPFEDDAVRPAPPMPSEVRRRLRPQPRPLLGPVAAAEMTSPYRVQTPPRLHQIAAPPRPKKPQLAKSILDRGKSSASRSYSTPQPSYRLTSAQSDVIAR